MFIITILGKSGRDKNSNEPTTAHYSKDESLDLPLKTGEFLNSTHCLFESFENANLTLIATQEAFEFQQRLFAQASPKSTERLNHCDFKPLSSENEFEEIFHQILEAIKKAKDEQIILDITHGFRHQPIIASFASVLGQINFKKSVQIIFAKSTDSKNSSTANTADTKDSSTQNFCYVSLQRYAEISLISLALNSFVSTLTLPELPLNSTRLLLPTLDALCKALHANVLNKTLLDTALNDLEKAKNSPYFKGFENLLEQIDKLLKELAQIANKEKKSEKFYLFAKFMLNRGFYLITATYISECLGHFMLEKFKNAGLLRNAQTSQAKNSGFSQPRSAKFSQKQANTKQVRVENTEYKNIEAIKDFIRYICGDKMDTSDKTDKCLNIGLAEQKARAKLNDFKYIKQTMDKIASLRNDLVHLQGEQTLMPKIHGDLQAILNNFENNILAPTFLQGF